MPLSSHTAPELWRIHALAKLSSIVTSGTPSNTGEATVKPNILAAHPKCVSRTCPRFIREGTPIGFKIISTGVPSAKYGISSSGRIRAITPLLPWRPAILSPVASLLVWATQTLTNLLTPGGNSSFWSRVTIFTSITLPRSPCFTLNEVSFTSRAFSPKIALKSFSSALSSVSPLGVILPTSISPGATSAPSRIIPSSSKFCRLSSPTLGISEVISSGPSFVSRASASCFSICIDVNLSSLTRRSFIMIASS